MEVDVDSDKGIDGWKSIGDLTDHGKELPKTIRQNTPSGGAYLFFESDVSPSNTSSFSHGINIHSDGYYVLLPPSIQSNDGKHEWAPGLSPRECELSKYPDFMRPAEQMPGSTQVQQPTIPSEIPGDKAIASAHLPMPQENTNGEPSWKSFPLNAMPKSVSRYIQAAADSIGCDPSFVGLPLLSAFAGAIGASTQIELKPDWQEPAVVWTAIIGDSGTRKTPALKMAARFADEQDKRALCIFSEKREEYEKKLEQYKANLKAWQRKPNGPSPTKPEMPVCQRLLTTDVTVDALVNRLRENPRGLLILCDELAGWLKSHNHNKCGHFNQATWLSIFNANSLHVDRRCGNRKNICVPHATASITGGIRPTAFTHVLGDSHSENALTARLLLAMPPKQPRKWTDQQIPLDTNQAMQQVFSRLWSLKAKEDQGGQLLPVNLPLTPDARQTWIEFYKRHGEEIAALTGNLASAWSKLEGYSARLALVCHLINWAAGDKTSPGPVDQKAMASGIALIEWFKNETRRVYAVMSETDSKRNQRRLIEWITQREGKTTVRECQQGHRRFKTANEAEAALNALVTASLGHWQTSPPTPNGGRAFTQFILSPPPSVYTTHSKPEKNEAP